MLGRLRNDRKRPVTQLIQTVYNTDIGLAFFNNLRQSKQPLVDDRHAAFVLFNGAMFFGRLGNTWRVSRRGARIAACVRRSDAAICPAAAGR